MDRNYYDLHGFSVEHPEEFWAKEANRLHWFKTWDRVLDRSKAPFFQWFPGGETNICYNAVDRHVLAGKGDQPAVIWESPEVKQSKTLTYNQLLDQVNRFSAVLQRNGVKRGDRVIIYLPMVAEAAVAMLSCVRIGAVHSVVFGGFAAESLADRINDSQPKLVICADASSRKGKPVKLKALVDKAIEHAKVKVPRCVVLNRGLDPYTPVEGRDVDWDEEMKAVGDAKVPAVPLKAEEASYILYTSGTTGKPKGVVRDTGGYMVALHSSMEMIYGCGPTDVYWSTSDIGWVVGHSYIIYGPLLYGIPTLMFEGTPDNPTPAIWWEIIEKYKVTVMFSAPTAMRILRKFPEHWMKQHDISSLRHIFLAGEPLDEPTYQWARQTLDKPIVDHYWQTESGWAMLTNHMGLDPLPIKPGSPTKPAMGWNLDVVDDKGNSVPKGTRGILVARPPLPPGALKTIWGDDDRFVESYWSMIGNKGQFYYSGDFAILDEDGYYWILGRADEVINVAGHRMGTREVEEVISDHPAVAEVSSIGIKDELKGQAIAAFVVLKQGIEPSEKIHKEIIQLVREKIGAIATPKTLQLVKALPKTRSGKVMRRVLKALCEERELGDLSTIEDGASVEEIKNALGQMGDVKID